MEASGLFHYSQRFRDNGDLGALSLLTRIQRQWRLRGSFITHQDLKTMEASGLFHYSRGFRDNGDLGVFHYSPRFRDQGDLGALSLLTRIKRQWRPRGPFITHQDLETMEASGLFQYSPKFRDNGGEAFSLLTMIKRQWRPWGSFITHQDFETMEASGLSHYSPGFRDNGGLGALSLLTKFRDNGDFGALSLLTRIKRQWRPRDFFITHQDLETMETSGLFHYSSGFRDNKGLGAPSVLPKI